jgi:UDP-N-acetyl-D-glucosamine/UDP-N-acetyl-D-galactosamine dehydrogenase
MGRHVVDRVIKLMAKARKPIADANVLILGLAFKENCPDIRNTRVIDLVNEFRTYHTRVDVHDPWVPHEDAQAEYGLQLVDTAPRSGYYDAIVLAVAHDQFRELGVDGIRRFGKPDAVLFDVKHVFPQGSVDGRL